MEAGFMTVAMAREQVSGLEKAVQATGRPDLAGQLAGCYHTLGRTADAATLYGTVWQKLRTGEVAANYSMALRELDRWDEAAALAQAALLENPDSQYIRLLWGEALLRAGHWKAAWPTYDTGRPTKLGERLRLGLPGQCKQWDGRRLGPGDFLFVLMEGGAGDRISYARWVSQLDEAVTRWKLFCYEPQAGFFLRLLGRERVILEGDALGEFADACTQTWWTTVFALPANFAAGPGDVPRWREGFALTASPEAAERYRMNPPPDGLPVLGLCWAAAELSPAGDPEARKVRSLSEAQAMRLVCGTADRVHWVGLQHGKTLGWPVSQPAFDTWEDTAGLLANLDGLVTVDTGTMHLAGALRRPLGILLGTNSDWKFLAKGRCPFYRDAAVWRGEAGGFDQAVNLAIAALRAKGLEALG